MRKKEAQEKVDITRVPFVSDEGRSDVSLRQREVENLRESALAPHEDMGDNYESPNTAAYDLRGLSSQGQRVQDEGKTSADSDGLPSRPTSWACLACTFINSIDSKTCEMCDGDAPPFEDVPGPIPALEAVTEGQSPSDVSEPMDTSSTSVYRPPNADAWERQEEAILREMHEEDKRQKNVPLEREPAGIDQFMLEKPSEEALALYKSQDMAIAAVDKLMKSESKDIAQVRTATQVRPGYDLLRVGNFHEDPSHTLPDIAFFHHRMTIDKVPQREPLIRAACLALRELCVTVFAYDPRLVTLFFEEGAPSRFIRQKVMLNLAPIEQYYGANKDKDTYLSEPFTYTYIYGLLIHKLAHFFDIVHGSRHNFFMTEYRSLYMMQWIALLESKGWEPETVEMLPYAEAHLYNVVL